MKAAILDESRTLSVGEVETPTIGKGEALVKVTMCGLCRSDLSFLKGCLKPSAYPHVLGHEITGTVMEAKPTNDYDRIYSRD